ncbi:MAG TPA: GNAT family N-acetyltransferase [Ramlibacter sp.]|uniref:GNAT family N-acetyltransferase n=1 Tax=Ramlibacter sp. TaxID=1917967 RepID=UPI002CE0B515|nr:GNAT family N-acetyltransferase [Ramlibacter sp.]HVZ42906.1 GNAT family N-acetyltransferase [Ramlibacter sp.]
MDDVESLERATLAAVPPRAQEKIEGWLVALDDGTVGRAHSAAPLMHDDVRVGIVPRIEARYRAQGLQPMFRLPQLASFELLRAVLRAEGYEMAKPTFVQTGTVEAMAAVAAPDGVRLDAQPGEGWASVFLGVGFDPLDGASRLAILRRSRDSVFASVEVQGRVAAVGAACFSHGWCGVHGMRTSPALRGKGFASRILAAFAQEARRRGIGRVFLQVEQGNATAQSVYRRAGFGTAWGYEYWAGQGG